MFSIQMLGWSKRGWMLISMSAMALGHSYFTQVAEVSEAFAAWRVTVAFFDRNLKLKGQRYQDRR